jgi:cilia- and flagella-associated protein 44
LVGTKQGNILQIEVPLITECDYTDTYLMPMKFKQYVIKMMESQKPKKDQMSIEFLMKKKNLEEKIDVEWESECILNVIYY